MTAKPLQPITAYAWVYHGKGLDPARLFDVAWKARGFGGAARGRVVPVRIVPIEDVEAAESVRPPRSKIGAKSKNRAIRAKERV